MAIRHLFRFLMIGFLGFSMLGCTVSNNSPTRASSGNPEKDLRTMSAALQRTILEGATSGAVIGPGFYYRTEVKPSASGAAQSAATGAAAGAAAGAYVGWIQQKYASQEGRLEQVKTDLDRNAVEIQTTINVMRDVLALQNRELSEIRARASSGAANPQDVATEAAQAQANLGEMQRAISGASRRQNELSAARGLVPVSGGGSQIDPELESLSGQIASMRAIAADLAENI